MKRKSIAVFLVFTVLGLAGCATVTKKFTRKPKTPSHVASAVYLEEGPYQKPFSNEYYYKTHFTLWKTWQDDVLDNLTGNAKKLQRAAEEAYSHLEQMRHYLKPEKQAALAPMLETMRNYRAKFDQGSYTKTEAASFRPELERVRRLVANDFYYEKVKDEIVPDTVDLGDTTSP